MKKISTFLLAALTLLTLSNCTASNHEKRNASLAPMDGIPIDPSDAVLAQAVEAFLRKNGAPAASRYELGRYDLNADGRRDALVLFKTPYGYWCDMNGCTMLIFKAHDDHFTLVNAIQPIREPVYISEMETNRWKNLFVRVSGRWDRAKDVAMQFNGQSYPSNPSNLPPYPYDIQNAPIRFFHDH